MSGELNRIPKVWTFGAGSGRRQARRISKEFQRDTFPLASGLG